MRPDDLIVTGERLYDVYPETGYRFLRYSAGKKIPRAEYERLIALNPKAAQAPVEVEPAPEPESDTPGLEALTRAQLMVEAKVRGVVVEARATKAQLIAALGE